MAKSIKAKVLLNLFPNNTELQLAKRCICKYFLKQKKLTKLLEAPKPYNSSFTAYVGAYLLRLSRLLIFLLWSAKLSTARVKRPQKESLDLKKLPRRDKMKNYGDLLFVLYSESKEEKVVLTRVQQRINVPYDRLKTYILELKELGLIEDEISLKLTEKGKLFISEYEIVLDSMKRMGLTYR